MSLAQTFIDLQVTQSQFCKDMRLSRSAASRLITHGQWPARGVLELRTAAESWLRKHGASPKQILPLFAAAENANKNQAVTWGWDPDAAVEVSTKSSPKEESMLLQNEALSMEARKHFGLPRNPFVDDVETPDDVYQTPSVRYVRAALMDCALHHGFVAVVGESGAGKSTLAEDLEERIKLDGKDIVVIRPYVLAMEADDKKGKSLKATHVADAIGAALDPQVKLKASSNLRFKQIHDMLITSHRLGRKHLLVIEEAHCMPRPMLKHLKRFVEMKDGLRRLLGVALVAQPELAALLASQNAEIREVSQRLEVIQLDPLDNELGGYLRHKFARFDLKLEDVMAEDAIDAIRRRLVHIPRGGKPTDARSECYPLVVNNLVARAMNAAAKNCMPLVTAEVIAGC